MKRELGPGWAVSANGPQGGAPQAGAEGGQVKKKGCGRDSVSSSGASYSLPRSRWERAMKEASVWFSDWEETWLDKGR